MLRGWPLDTQEDPAITTGPSLLLDLAKTIGGLIGGIAKGPKLNELRTFSFLVAGAGFEPTTFGL